MRYKDLLIVIGLVTLACWTWAEPAPDVVPVPREPVFLSREPVSPTVEPSPARTSEPSTGHSFLKPTPLQISVTAGESFDSTIFQVSIPEGVRSLVHPQDTVGFEVSLGDSRVSLRTSELSPSRPWTWRFTGADLTLSERSQPWDRHSTRPTSVYVTTFLNSKAPRRYQTRGANLHFFGGPSVELDWK